MSSVAVEGGSALKKPDDIIRGISEWVKNLQIYNIKSVLETEGMESERCGHLQAAKVQ